MSLRLDHLVVLVFDLDEAVADYRKLGFTVQIGGDHPDGVTHNALVAFADGSYLELIAFRRPAPDRRWWRVGQSIGEGLVDMALLPADTAGAVGQAAARGLVYDGPTPGGRTRPDGVRLAWTVARPRSFDLPLLCGDVTPRAERVPAGAATIHPNGALGIASVTIAVADMATSLARWRALLGTEGPPAEIVTVAGLGQVIATLAVGASRIVLVSTSDARGPAGEAIARHVAARGEGPYAVGFGGPAGTGERARSNRLAAHGLRFEWVDDPAAPAVARPPTDAVA